MKIEKVNDHQIRCTLTREDLADRELKLSELAYGTEKAKDLFRDMMQQASFEFGFEAEDIPLMIEAIPLNSECIVLIITKVEDPDELDTRFSKFAPSVHEDDSTLDDVLDTIAEGADDVLDLFKKLQNSKAGNAAPEDSSQTGGNNADIEEAKRSFKNALQKKLADTAASMELTRLYSFKSLREVTGSAHILSGFYSGTNSLYKQKDGSYLLVLSKSSHTPVEFNKICNILSEYGASIKSVPASEAYLEEHFEPIIKNTALQSLSCI
ncbi:MAG: adaptor protein MecA [Lachnospiraceae bacterium]|jgi:adapter protein MecA 1/2|nr:adaptor protein MecA [Lachnospiraceae bacterium]NBH25720.1 adaptor protein MecA [Lachnospiraceae bacterium]GFI18415.1 adapter protein MecA 2 [Lachnospiraceae bacterium]